MSHSKIAEIYKIYVTNYGSRLSLSDFWYSNAYKFLSLYLPFRIKQFNGLLAFFLQSNIF